MLPTEKVFTAVVKNVLQYFHYIQVGHEVSQHPRLETESDGDHDRDSLGYYKCRNHDCPHVFTTNATRKRHERVQHQEDYQTAAPDATGATATDKGKEAKADCIYNYHNARLQCGLLILNMMDAIKEGDGTRLMQCYKVVLLFEYKFKHTKVCIYPVKEKKTILRTL
ncbi:hypothetical protein OS493_008020 [Desmophyllum pertusum]|uniref:C2H2-type domain-containing protein n=1 Tax=Desmophyllum pertusum TaxID=174260 RepID=A0A9X0CFM1_9CNID|nr:hypothetical protein OS493_008020 [Desmophyllum pertusum]